MAKKKKAAPKQNDEAVLPSPSTEPASPGLNPPPPSTVGASTGGENTPEENVIVVEDKPEDKLADADALKEKGNVAFKAAKYAEAIKLYSEAIDLVPSQAAYYANRAAALIATKQFREALVDCQQARTLQQSAPQLKTLIRLARCQLATGSPGPALSTLREAQALEAETKTHNKDLWNFKNNAELMQRHLDSVTKARERKDWTTASAALDAARKMLEGAGKDVPTEWRCWSVQLKMARSDWDGATDAVRDALRFESNSPDVHALRGQVLFLTNKPADATSILRHALTLDPENGTARKMLKRVKELEKVKDDGNSAFKGQRWEEAARKYSDALDIVGTDPEEGEGGMIRAILLSNRAIAYHKMGTAEKVEEALADLRLSLKLYPDNWKAVRTRARIRLARDEYEEAISDFREAMELAENMAGTEGAQREIQDELRKAEVLLKRSKEKDYYKILGLSRTATDPEIKKAYRKESLKHHPDKGGDEEQFKLVVEANAVLSDPDKRRRYDLGEDIDGQMNSEGGMGGFPGGGVDISEMLFAQMFGGGGGGGGFQSSPFGSAGGPFGGSRRGHGHSHSQGFGF
ncbi:hypothetical protein M408DRAFT_331174 [Serendipita vermifera MAFF 305830]|uniref:J domain-containing protein n=1 Tax=Serendipita vermifera MAFF 305830 TaxID=933852 RepID=A0A0C3ALE2_SERVB|nr:hypothetical protein M408DRAFT_331174 [Serendipita vermifera MAFF 305830]